MPGNSGGRRSYALRLRREKRAQKPRPCIGAEGLGFRALVGQLPVLVPAFLVRPVKTAAQILQSGRLAFPLPPSTRLAAIPQEAEPQKPRPKERKRRGFWHCFHIRNSGCGDVDVVESERGGALGYQGRAYWSRQRTTGVEIGHEAPGQSGHTSGASTRVAEGQDVADATSGLSKGDRATVRRYERAAGQELTCEGMGNRTGRRGAFGNRCAGGAQTGRQ